MLPSCESSYGWSNTDRDGWPDRYYYAYYTSLGERDGSQYAEAVLYTLILIFSLLANILIIASITRRKDMQTVMKCFVVNLAIADLVFVLSIPAIVTARVSHSWNLGETTCKMLPYFQFVCGSVLLWTLAAISIDRVRCLAKAPYRSGLTKKSAIALIIIAWLVALLVFLPVAIFFREQDVKYIGKNATAGIAEYSTICTLVFPPSRSINSSLTFTLIMVFMSCILPMVILVYNFQVILRKLATIQGKLEEKIGHVHNCSKFRFSLHDIANSLNLNRTSKEVIESPSGHHLSIVSPRESKNHHSSISSLNRLKKHRRAVRILFCNTFAVLAMWLPITVVMFLIYADGHRKDSNYFLSNQYFIWSVVVALMNTIVNPIIYGFLTGNRREHIPFKEWFSGRCCFGWSDSMESENKNSSSQNSKNVTIRNYCAENPITVDSQAR